MSGKKNLIMGLLSNMVFDQAEAFLASLLHTGYRGDVCMLVDNVTPQTVDLLQAHGVIVEPANLYGRAELPPLSNRFFGYLEFLSRRADEYDNVMLTDLRDVVFQSDPFAQPLPADIVYAQERGLVGGQNANQGWILDTYGRAVLHNLADWLVSCAGTTFGTTAGVLRYLVAMTRELGELRPPVTGGVDQAVHNFIVRMRPLRNAWCDTTDSLVATMHFVPEESVRMSPDGVLIDGRLVPVLHQWDRNRTTLDYVWNAPRFRLGTAPQSRRSIHATRAVPAAGPATDRADAVVAFYHRPRDAGWLEPFLGSLRRAGHAGGVHCVGVFDADELAVLARHRCTAHRIGPTDAAYDIENLAHLHLSSVLGELAGAGEARPDQVLVLDNLRAAFQRDPFQSKTIGLSVFCEGPTRLGESRYNLDRLAMFTSPDQAMLRQPIISSALLRGRLQVVGAFYQRLLSEFVGRPELMRVPKVIQGAFNKVCRDEGLGFPVIVHPLAAEAYFDFWACPLELDTTRGLRFGGALPSIILGGAIDGPLLRNIWQRLGLGPSLATARPDC